MTKHKDEVPIRIQIACYNILVAEVIVESYFEAHRTWAAFAVKKYNKNLPLGCASMRRADLPRDWNVPVGSTIYTERVH